LERGDLHNYALLMHEHWMHKKRRSQGMSNSDIDKWYALGLESGALGGKVIGAGGGGFLMFYTEDKRRLRRAMTDQGLREVRFRFDHEGAKVIVA
jgi:D-glycero-alpha-D-manno-heptose-7-phosphate kinase